MKTDSRLLQLKEAFNNDRKFFLQGVQAIGGLGLLQILIAFVLPRVYPLEVLKVLIGVNQLLFVTLIAWYATQLRYDRRWSVAFGVFSLIPVLGFLPAALLYWKSEQVEQHAHQPGQAPEVPAQVS